MITVLRDRYVPSWPKSRDCSRAERGYVMPIGDALERAWTTDAHFTAYRTPNGRRLSHDALDGELAVELTHVVLDVDGAGHVATPEWCAELRDRVQRLAADHPAPFFYETRGGARLVYRQAEPTIIRTRDDAREWRRVYSVVVAYLARRYGIEADPACSDFTRLYRLPRATREIGGRPENHPSWGDPHAIGVLQIDADWDDVDTARAAAPKAWSAPRVANYTPCSSSGDGLLYWLLRARGDVLREHGPGAYVVRCPRERDHTTGQTGDGSTLLYLPAAGEQIGAIHCMHAHCASMTTRDWIACWSESEIQTARIAAGIVSTEEIAALDELRREARQHGYSAGWIAHRYRERYGRWPAGGVAA